MKIIRVNGTTEFLNGIEDLSAAIQTHMGEDAREAFDCIVSEKTEELERDAQQAFAAYDDMEQAADGYRSMAVGTMEELDGIISRFFPDGPRSGRLNKQALYDSLCNLKRDLYNNL